MSDKDKIISEVYYDQAGFGSIATTYKDAKKKDASITMQDVKEWFQENVERKKQLSGYNSFIAPDINFEYQLDLFFISKNDLDNQKYRCLLTAKPWWRLLHPSNLPTSRLGSWRH